MREWLKARKGKVVGALVAALTVAVLTGGLKLPLSVAQPVANALAAAAVTLVADEAGNIQPDAPANGSAQ